MHPLCNGVIQEGGSHMRFAIPVAYFSLLVALAKQSYGARAMAWRGIVQDATLYHDISELLSSLEQLPYTCHLARYEAVHDSTTGVFSPLVTVSNWSIPAQHKRTMLITFGEHGREVITSEVAVWMIKFLACPTTQTLLGSWMTVHQLLAALPAHLLPPAAAQGHTAHQEAVRRWVYGLLETTIFQFVPVVSIASRLLVEEGRLCQRKSASGVDLNRNWNLAWGGNEVGAHHEEHGGAFPFSEPETRLIRFIARRAPPAAYISVHSGEWAMYTPWDSQPRRSPLLPVDTDTLLQRLRSVCPQCSNIGPSGQLAGYLAHGTAMDWMHGVLGTPYAFTFEVYGPQDDEDAPLPAAGASGPEELSALAKSASYNQVARQAGQQVGSGALALGSANTTRHASSAELQWQLRKLLADALGAHRRRRPLNRVTAPVSMALLAEFQRRWGPLLLELRAAARRRPAASRPGHSGSAGARTDHSGSAGARTDRSGSAASRKDHSGSAAARRGQRASAAGSNTAHRTFPAALHTEQQLGVREDIQHVKRSQGLDHQGQPKQNSKCSLDWWLCKQLASLTGSAARIRVVARSLPWMKSQQGTGSKQGNQGQTSPVDVHSRRELWQQTDSVADGVQGDEDVQELIMHSPKMLRECFRHFNPISRSDYRQVVTTWTLSLLTVAQHVQDHAPAAEHYAQPKLGGWEEGARAEQHPPQAGNSSTHVQSQLPSSGFEITDVLENKPVRGHMVKDRLATAVLNVSTHGASLNAPHRPGEIHVVPVGPGHVVPAGMVPVPALRALTLLLACVLVAGLTSATVIAKATWHVDPVGPFTRTKVSIV